MIEIKTEEQFQKEVLEKKEPVLVDFYADWCGPCKAMAPMLEEFEKEHSNCTICKINVDELMQLALQYRVVSVPSILLFRDGTCDGRCVGLSSQDELEDLLQSAE